MEPRRDVEFDTDAALDGIADPDDEGSHLAVQADVVNWAIIGSVEMDDYVHETEGSVVVFSSGGQVVRELGRFIVTRVDVDSAILEGESVFDIFDMSASTIDYTALYEYGTWEFKQSVLRVLKCDDEYVPSSLLIIDRLELGRSTAAGASACRQ